MKAYDLLRQLDRADICLAEIGPQGVNVKLDIKDFQLQIMHITNGQNLETGVKPVWSKHKQGVMTIKSTL